MFDLHKWTMDMLLGAVGHWPDYEIMRTANGYVSKGVLDDADRGQIQEAIDLKNNPPAEEPVDTDMMVEETPEV